MFKTLFANWQRFLGNFRGLWGNLGGFGKKILTTLPYGHILPTN